NETHESKTDPDAKLYRKGKTASARPPASCATWAIL
ncbi:Mobile element protein, partial (plasmid) [Cupriavidus necator H850]